jgi:hypothetical protein
MQSMAEYKTTIEKTDEGTRITSGNMTDEHAARLAAERERTKDMDVDDASQAAQDSLEDIIKAKKKFTEMQSMLALGKYKDMTDEQKEKFVAEYKKLKADYSFAKGGMSKQMELFEPVERGFDDGGLMDEGGTIDPVSGNDVPPGSTQEEVRDDIPAQLSEGEFVFPADVVRYIGLESLMRMRQEAKQGLAQMEAMGQMGNSEEAVMPDNLPFNMYDLDIEEDEEYNMASGGVIKAANGTLATGTYKLPNTTGSYTTPAPVTTGYTPPPALTQPFQPYTPQFTTATQEQGAFIPKTIDPLSPTFGEFIGQNIPGVDFDYVEYVNDAGQIIKLRVDKATGELLDPIPEGYKVKTEEVQKTTSETQRVETAQVRGGGDNGTGADGKSPGASTAFGGELVDGRVVGGYVGDLAFENMSIKQAQAFGLSGIPSFLGQLAGKPNTNTIPDDVNATVTNLSKTRPKGVYSSPAEVEVAATIRMKGTTYNDLLTNKAVTQRQRMASAIDFIKEKYGDDAMDPAKIIDLDIELADMDMREDVRETLASKDFSKALKEEISANNEIGNVSVDSSGNISINNPFEAERVAIQRQKDEGKEVDPSQGKTTSSSGSSGPTAPGGGVDFKDNTGKSDMQGPGDMGSQDGAMGGSGRGEQGPGNKAR